MKQQLLGQLSPLGQDHLLRFWDQLDESGRQRLAAQIGEVDFAQLDRLFHLGASAENWSELAQRATPPAAFRLGARNRFSPDQARAAGRNALSDGEIGVVLVAGGQGTRLGFPHPKGMFPIGPISGASLFRILLEKVLAVSRRYQAPMPLYVMTSPATHDETVAYFEENERFGLPVADVTIFCQGTMPAVDAKTGKVLLAEKDSLALSPDGHGGTVAALVRSGALDDIRRRDLRHLFYLQVDNPLVEMCDAELIGYHLLSDSELSTQVVAKQAALDRVGNFVSIDGAARIIEYSDLPPEVANRTNDDGSLKLWAGNAAVHAIAVDFLQRAAGSPQALPFHFARKKVPYIDTQGKRIEPPTENAIKFERFIFDLLPLARNPIAVEVDECQTFAPVKNAPGAPRYTPERVQAQMSNLYQAWLRAAGAHVDEGSLVEISPLFALDAGDLREKIAPGLHVHGEQYFG